MTSRPIKIKFWCQPIRKRQKKTRPENFRLFTTLNTIRFLHSSLTSGKTRTPFWPWRPAIGTKYFVMSSKWLFYTISPPNYILTCWTVLSQTRFWFTKIQDWTLKQSLSNDPIGIVLWLVEEDIVIVDMTKNWFTKKNLIDGKVNSGIVNWQVCINFLTTHVSQKGFQIDTY